MKRKIFPQSQRYLVWAGAIAAFFLIVLTGYIAVQSAVIDREVEELRLSTYQSVRRAR